MGFLLRELNLPFSVKGFTEVIRPKNVLRSFLLFWYRKFFRCDKEAGPRFSFARADGPNNLEDESTASNAESDTSSRRVETEYKEKLFLLRREAAAWRAYYKEKYNESRGICDQTQSTHGFSWDHPDINPDLFGITSPPSR